MAEDRQAIMLPFLPTPWGNVQPLSLSMPTVIAFTVALSFIHPQLAVQKQNSSSKILLKILGLDVLDFPPSVSLNAVQWCAD